MDSGSVPASSATRRIARGCLTISGKNHTIYDGLNLIGRNPRAGINIKNVNVSQHHAIITVVNENQLYLSDFGSSNGTFLNGQRLKPLEIYSLDETASIKLGDIVADYKRVLHESGDNCDLEMTQDVTQGFYSNGTQAIDSSTFPELPTQLAVENEPDFHELPTQYVEDLHNLPTQILHFNHTTGSDNGDNSEDSVDFMTMPMMQENKNTPPVDSDQDESSEVYRVRCAKKNPLDSDSDESPKINKSSPQLNFSGKTKNDTQAGTSSNNEIEANKSLCGSNNSSPQIVCQKRKSIYVLSDDETDIEDNDATFNDSDIIPATQNRSMSGEPFANLSSFQDGFRLELSGDPIVTTVKEMEDGDSSTCAVIDETLTGANSLMEANEEIEDHVIGEVDQGDAIEVVANAEGIGKIDQNSVDSNVGNAGCSFFKSRDGIATEKLQEAEILLKTEENRKVGNAGSLFFMPQDGAATEKMQGTEAEENRNSGRSQDEVGSNEKIGGSRSVDNVESCERFVGEKLIEEGKNCEVGNTGNFVNDQNSQVEENRNVHNIGRSQDEVGSNEKIGGSRSVDNVENCERFVGEKLIEEGKNCEVGNTGNFVNDQNSQVEENRNVDNIGRSQVEAGSNEKIGEGCSVDNVENCERFVGEKLVEGQNCEVGNTGNFVNDQNTRVVENRNVDNTGRSHDKLEDNEEISKERSVDNAENFERFVGEKPVEESNNSEVGIAGNSINDQSTQIEDLVFANLSTEEFDFSKRKRKSVRFCEGTEDIGVKPTQPLCLDFETTEENQEVDDDMYIRPTQRVDTGGDQSEDVEFRSTSDEENDLYLQPTQPIVTTEDATEEVDDKILTPKTASQDENKIEAILSLHRIEAVEDKSDETLKNNCSVSSNQSLVQEKCEDVADEIRDEIATSPQLENNKEISQMEANESENYHKILQQNDNSTKIMVEDVFLQPMVATKSKVVVEVVEPGTSKQCEDLEEQLQLIFASQKEKFSSTQLVDILEESLTRHEDKTNHTMQDMINESIDDLFDDNLEQKKDKKSSIDDKSTKGRKRHFKSEDPVSDGNKAKKNENVEETRKSGRKRKIEDQPAASSSMNSKELEVLKEVKKKKLKVDKEDSSDSGSSSSRSRNSKKSTEKNNTEGNKKSIDRSKKRDVKKVSSVADGDGKENSAINSATSDSSIDVSTKTSDAGTSKEEKVDASPSSRGRRIKQKKSPGALLDDSEEKRDQPTRASLRNKNKIEKMKDDSKKTAVEDVFLQPSPAKISKQNDELEDQLQELFASQREPFSSTQLVNILEEDLPRNETSSSMQDLINESIDNLFDEDFHRNENKNLSCNIKTNKVKITKIDSPSAGSSKDSHKSEIVADVEKKKRLRSDDHKITKRDLRNSSNLVVDDTKNDQSDLTIESKLRKESSDRKEKRPKAVKAETSKSEEVNKVKKRDLRNTSNLGVEDTKNDQSDLTIESKLKKESNDRKEKRTKAVKAETSKGEEVNKVRKRDLRNSSNLAVEDTKNDQSDLTIESKLKKESNDSKEKRTKTVKAETSEGEEVNKVKKRDLRNTSNLGVEDTKNDQSDLTIESKFKKESNDRKEKRTKAVKAETSKGEEVNKVKKRDLRNSSNLAVEDTKNDQSDLTIESKLKKESNDSKEKRTKAVKAETSEGEEVRENPSRGKRKIEKTPNDRPEVTVLPKQRRRLTENFFTDLASSPDGSVEAARAASQVANTSRQTATKTRKTRANPSYIEEIKVTVPKAPVTIIQDTSNIEVTPSRKSARQSRATASKLAKTLPPVIEPDVISISSTSSTSTAKSRRLSANSRSLRQVEKSIPLSRKIKTASSEDEFEAGKNSSLNSSIASTSSERGRRKLKPKVAFTMMDDPSLESAIRQLGGSVVDSVDTCTVLVTAAVKRSCKLLTAVGQGKPICSTKWVLESKKASSFLDPWDYIINDEEAEEKWQFSLRESLEKSTKTKLMEGYTFQLFVTAGADVLKGAIEACGGKCVNRTANCDNFVIVATTQNKSKYSKMLKQRPDVKVVEPEAIFDGTLRQELRFDRHLLS